jgi:GLPGLI family protein
VCAGKIALHTRVQYILSFILLLFTGTGLHAQNSIFLTQGRIEFEKRENIWAKIDSLAYDDDSWKALMKKTTPQFATTYFDLKFKGTKSLYLPGREDNNGNGNRFFGDAPANDNIVFSNFDNQQGISQKSVYEEKFLIQDSLRQIKWKITDETRIIAGLECRRANALIMDSIYIVAFYTDAIVTPGGPESFTGLPGMILGISIPHEHLSWFATKVYTDVISEKELIPPAKGKKVTNITLLALLKDRMKDWGRWATKNIQAVML